MVFTQTYEPGTIKLYNRWQVILIAFPVMLATILSIISAKLSPVSLALTLVSIATFAYLRGDLKFPRPNPNRVVAGILAFAAFSALSAAWSPVPETSLISAASLVATFSVAYACIGLSIGERAQPIRHLAEGLWLGLLLASLYYVVDVMTGQSIKIAVYNMLGLHPGHLLPKWAVWKDGKVVQIGLSDATRNAFAFPLLLWPALMAVSGGLKGNLRTALKCFLVAIVWAGVFLSPNDTAKLSIVAGTAVYWLASSARVWSFRTVVLGWAVACFLMIPIAVALSGSPLATAKEVPPNARARLVIWKLTAGEVLKSPIGGRGANATQFISHELRSTQNKIEGLQVLKSPVVAAHAHNIYLQTWFELGVIGAALLWLSGHFLLLHINQFSDRIYRYGLATFVSGATLAASSYGLWQFWFLSMFAFTACLFQIGKMAQEIATPTGH